MLPFRNSSTVSLFLLRRVRTAQPSRLHKRSRVRSIQFSRCCCAVWKWSVFLQVYFLMPVDRLERKGKGKAAVKIGMQYGKLVTDSRFYKSLKWKRKTGFRAIASAVRESVVCLHRSFATGRWVDEFLDATNLQIDRGVTRLDGARGKK